MGSAPDHHHNVSRGLLAGAETGPPCARTHACEAAHVSTSSEEPCLHLSSSPAAPAAAAAPAAPAPQPTLGRRVANKNTP